MTVHHQPAQSWAQYINIGTSIVTQPHRVVFFSGQTAKSDSGATIGTDMQTQFAAAVQEITHQLTSVGMTPANIVRATIFTTNIEECKRAYGPMQELCAAAGITPAGTMVEVRRFAEKDLLVEIEVTAAD